jgi:hypothetical protein
MSERTEDRMDVLCPVCGEPWDHDTLHDEAAARQDLAVAGMNAEEAAVVRLEYDATFAAVTSNFRASGCRALTLAVGMPGTRCAPLTPANRDRANAASAMYELLGDDMDGAAALLADLHL